MHLVTLLVTVCFIVYSDYIAFQYFRGTRTILNHQHTLRMHYVVLVGLFGMILSGIVLAIPRIDYLLTQLVFYVKMFFVVVLVFNAWVIGKVSKVASERTCSQLTTHERQTLITSGVISFIGWIGSAIIGLLFL